jgi:hypothetical protein
MNSVDSLNLCVALEHSIWQALKEGDAAADARLLSDKFRGVYTTGIADKSAHMGQLQDGPTVSWYELRDPQVLRLADDVICLTYLARYGRPANPAQPEVMYVTSIWQREAEAWVNVFSQDTPCEPERRPE